MKKIFSIVLIIWFISCKTAFPNEKKLNYTAGVKVGDDWKKKELELGTPDKKGKGYSSYISKGYVVFTNNEGTIVTRMSYGWFRGGAHFTGEVYGIKIADTYPKVVRLWGEPTETGMTDESAYSKKWQFKKFGILVEFWAEGGNDPEFGGKYEIDTIRRIEITVQ